MTLKARESAMRRVVEHRMLEPNRRDAHGCDLRDIKILRADQLERVRRQLMTFSTALLAAAAENSQGREDLGFRGLSNPLGCGISLFSREGPTRQWAAKELRIVFHGLRRVELAKLCQDAARVKAVTNLEQG
jgi:hypothetical protein